MFGDKAQLSGCFPAIRTLLMDYPSLPSMPREARRYGNRGDVCVREMMMMMMMMMAERSSLADLIRVFALICTDLIIVQAGNLH